MEHENSLQTISNAATGNAEIELILQKAQTSLSTINEQLDTITTAASQALAIKTQVLDAQTVIATKSDHIEDARKHADTARAELDRAVTSASQQASEADGIRNRAQAAADSLAKLLAESQTNKGLADADIEAIAEARNTAKESAAALKAMSDKADSVQKKLTDYEARLANLEKQCAQQLQTITDLLPGATSTGLAHAFDARRQTFLNPAKWWQIAFVGSLTFLVILALTGLWQIYDRGSVITYDELGRIWLARFPVAAALVWLALHASREAALAKRLEEDYGYKAAISSSFMGFHKQMEDIGSTEASTPLGQLCGDTLATIASPPGRIYDKHALTVTPGTEFKETVKGIAS